jgi:hypothetical protein
MKAIIAGLLAATSACTSETVAPVDVSGGAAGPAYLEVQFTDTSDALAQWPGMRPKLVVGVGRVEIEHADGRWVTISGSLRQVDLLGLEAGNAHVISTSVLPPGGYSAVRVTVENATLLVPDQAPQPIAVVNSTVEIAMTTDLADTQSYALVLDFNAADSMVSAQAPALATNPTPSTKLGAMAPAISLYSMGRM